MIREGLALLAILLEGLKIRVLQPLIALGIGSLIVEHALSLPEILHPQS